MKCERICSFLLLVSFCLCNQSLASDIIKVKPTWQTALSYKDWMDMHPTVMKTKDGYFVTGISHNKTDSNEYEYKVMLWKISPEGKELWAKDINLDSWGEKFVPHHCFAIQDEQTVLIIGSAKAWLIRLDDNGEVIFSKELSIQQFDDIRGIKKTDDGLFLYGSVYKGKSNSEDYIIKGDSGACKIKSNSDAWITKLSKDGNEIWRREYDKGKMEWGTGLAPLKDGGFILSADSGNYNKFGSGPSEAWIVKCDSKGKILKETIFEGRHPSVIINGDVAVVVFNKEDFPQQDMVVIGLDKKLKTRWQIDSLFGKRGGLGMLATIVNKRGNFVLAGSKFGTAGLWEISKEGKIIKEYEIEGSDLGVQLELMQTSNGYLIAGDFLTKSKMPLAADGKVAKGAHWDSADIQIAEIADTNN